MTIFIIEIIEGIFGHLNGKPSLKTSALRQARRCKVTMLWNGGLVEAQHNHVHFVFSA